MISSYLYLASIIVLGIGAVWLVRALMKKRSRKRSLRMLMLGVLLFVGSVVTKSMDSWIVLAFGALILLGVLYYWRSTDKAERLDADSDAGDISHVDPE